MNCSEEEVKAAIAKYKSTNKGLSPKELIAVIQKDITSNKLQQSRLGYEEAKVSEMYHTVMSHPEGPTAGIRAYIETDKYGFVPNHENIYSIARAYVGEWNTDVPVAIMRKIDSFTGIDATTKNSTIILRDDTSLEMHGVDTGNEEAKEIAKYFKEAIDVSIEELEARGITDVARLSINYGKATSTPKLRAKAEEHLLKITTLSKEEISKELDSVGLHKSSRFTTEDIFVSTEARAEFIRTYTEDPISAVTGIVERNSKTLANYEVFGSIENFNTLLAIADKVDSEAGRTSIVVGKDIVKKTYELAIGKEDEVALNVTTGVKGVKALGNIATASLLPKAILLTPTDMGLAALQVSKYSGVGAGLKHLLAMLVPLDNVGIAQEASRLGVKTDIGFGSKVARFNDYDVTGVTGGLADLAMRFNLLQAASSRNRNLVAVAVTKGVLDNLGQYKATGKVPLVLRETGIDKVDIDRLSKLDKEDYANWDLDDRRIVMGIVDYAMEKGQTEPSNTTTALMQGGGDRDSLNGELFKLGTKFMGFPIQLWGTHVTNVVNNVNLTRTEKVTELTRVAGVMLVMGIIGGALQDAYSNKTPEKGSPFYMGDEEVTTEDYVKFFNSHLAHDTQVGLVAGKIYDLVIDKKFYSDAGKISSPSLNAVKGVATLASEVVKYGKDGDAEKLGKVTVKLIGDLAPDSTLTHHVQEAIFDYAYKTISPKEHAKSERNKKKYMNKKGQDYILDTSN